MARQHLGQHFLADAGWREEIAREIRVSPQSITPTPLGQNAEFCWIEIGAGHGEMTEHLAYTGVPVHAVELDPLLARHCSDWRSASLIWRSFRGHSGIRHRQNCRRKTGARVRELTVLHYFADFASPVRQRRDHRRNNIVIQHEVALRLAAKPGTRDYGYLSVLTQYFSRPELVMDIPRDAFRPPPEVNSALVTLRLPGERRKLPHVDETAFLEFVKLCFSQKRKTLVNNLKSQVRLSLFERFDGTEIANRRAAEQLP